MDVWLIVLLGVLFWFVGSFVVALLIGPYLRNRQP